MLKMHLKEPRAGCLPWLLRAFPAMVALFIVILASASYARAGTLAESPESSLSQQTLERKLKKRDPSLALSAEAVLMKRQHQEKIVLIDVRHQDEYQRLRIPGSLSIPLYGIKTKSFLKPQILVLLNEGYRYSQLEKECRVLRGKGFSAWILDGGLNYWRQKQAPLEGDLLAQKGFNKVSPAIFFEDKNFEGQIVIDASPVQSSQSRHLIPSARHIPFLDDPKGAALKLKEILSKGKRGAFQSVLICTQEGERYERIDKAIEKLGIKNAFYLEGGVTGYGRFLKSLALSRVPREDRVKRMDGCTTCGQ